MSFSKKSFNNNNNNNNKNYNNNNKNYNNKNYNNKNSKFCKVCYDAQLPESEYTSHWVKDQPGKYGNIVCPYLLSLECGYCKGKGHTPKHCPKILLKNEYNENINNEKKQTPLKQIQTPLKQIQKSEEEKQKNIINSKNIFNLLDNEEFDSETDSETEYENKSDTIHKLYTINKSDTKSINNYYNNNINDFPSILESKNINTQSIPEKKLNNWISVLKSKPQPKLHKQSLQQPIRKPSLKQNSINIDTVSIDLLNTKSVNIDLCYNICKNNNKLNYKEVVKQEVKSEVKSEVNNDIDNTDICFNLNPNMRWADIMEEDEFDGTAF